MFDISWTEFVLIGVVALIVIGPKELPAVMRTMGQWTRKVRSMAADFQGQFQEAMREAEMADLKKQVDDIAHEVKSYDPLQDVRTDIEAMGRDIQTSLEDKPPLAVAAASDAVPQPAAALQIAEGATALAGTDVVAAAIGPAAQEAVDNAQGESLTTAAQIEPREQDAVGVATGPVVPEAPEKTAQSDGTRRAG
jgi:sec-independent protein translocase protein TatB